MMSSASTDPKITQLTVPDFRSCEKISAILSKGFTR